MTGDLLEVYREQPAIYTSPMRRNAWYGRQVLGVFLRACWQFPAISFAALILNDASNVFRNVSGSVQIPDLLGPTLVTVLLTAGIVGGWRAGRAVGGIVTAVATHACAWSAMTLWWVLTTYPFALVQQHEPYWINAWQGSATPGESFIHWIAWDNVGAVVLGGTALLALSIVAGLVGGLTGSHFANRTKLHAA